MGNQLIVLVVGFALTTVVGGALGFFFQQRNAELQYRAHLQEAERSTALNLFEEISTLMDRRLYRMRQLCWQLQRNPRQDSTLEPAINAYREIVQDWNDRLNRNLAVAEIYFGYEVRKRLHNEIYRGFAEVGIQLEDAYRDMRTRVGPIEAALDSLALAVYEFNVVMIRHVRDGQVGAFLPEVRTRDAGIAGAEPLRPGDAEF
jgi:hypothetical protein